MRLIHTTTLDFHEFFSDIPEYAILSHTWGEDEVSFQNMSSPDRSQKKGYSKIVQTCDLACQNGIEYAWVDTCCINKTSSAELTESINSMFQWYQDAVVCYAFLDDLSPQVTVEQGLSSCRWLTRGWTLQELLAPKSLIFFDSERNKRGTKLEYADIISKATGIPKDVILGETPLTDCSVAQKMSWAASRKTTRSEDGAYCLLGIFDVNMPLIYGEGRKAFRRLQEEIIKHRSDLTVLAWDCKPNEGKAVRLFAKSASAFANSSHIQPFSDDFENFSVTNKGLLVSGSVPMRIASVTKPDGTQSLRYVLLLGFDASCNSPTSRGIFLRKVSPGLFYRDAKFPLANFNLEEIQRLRKIFVINYYIFIDGDIIRRNSFYIFRRETIHVPAADNFQLIDAVPESLWDHSDQVFLRPAPYKFSAYPMVLAMLFQGSIEGQIIHIVVLCDYDRRDAPKCKIFNRAAHHRQAAVIFTGRQKTESILWADFRLQFPELSNLTHTTVISVGNQIRRVSVALEKGSMETLPRNKQCFRVKVNVDNLPT
ncbi:uncharacterized protein Z518_05360 [Rhinocladiella mackenziei CBS 650.93]|uniref:Heterokaryon incompatibility domain-containing protein n=1 Tax=Rhinocladiella mackenziei CBS 650.93 TaxID=1442369 RepID=A0A0D2J626_9EURO|nr:uncharacterized protein Z518_05360 [Rhinocladiella mackenziei CBS 650.93]KIX04490.1 hypothetical protein Z518_05360 [Rhinocladiella mackenziei CBS 650.93]